MNVLVSTNSYFDYIICHFVQTILGCKIDHCYVYKNNFSEGQKENLHINNKDYNIDFIDRFDIIEKIHIDVMFLMNVSTNHIITLFDLACKYNSTVKYFCDITSERNIVERYSSQVNVEIIEMYSHNMKYIKKKYLDKVVILIGSVLNISHQEYLELYLKAKFESYGMNTYIIWSNSPFSKDGTRLHSLDFSKSFDNKSVFTDLLDPDSIYLYNAADIVILSLYDGVFEIDQQPNCYYPSIVKKVSPDYTILVADKSNYDNPKLLKNTFETIYKTKMDYCLCSDISLCKSPRLSKETADYFVNEIDINAECSLLFNNIKQSLTLPWNCKKIN